jgi:hypothetical protein
MSRLDVEVYNEATGWVITSKGVIEQDLGDIEGDQDAWKAAIADGIFVPLELVQDDSILVRVVFDEPLLLEENEEWVGHFTSRLRVPDGVLTLTGGSEYISGEEADDYTQHVEVPRGDYQVDVYTYLPFLNGEYCLKQASDEPWGAYFRRTRPGEEFPLWLQNECIDDPEIDPGHENEWPEDREIDDDEETDYVMFLVHLSRAEKWNDVPVAALNTRGWIDIASGARQPAQCPLGIRFDQV